MSKLHKKMVELGDLSNYTYDELVESCGAPCETCNFEFSDIGMGKRAKWTDGKFTIGLNFKPNGEYCGIYFHRNIEPYIIAIAVTAALIVGALVGAYFMRNSSKAPQEAPKTAYYETVSANEEDALTEVMDIEF
ncbi:MAG: hypothetical protein GX684_00935 [Ruminococcaceae bacterium]|nr:hypothetical protein [Oscillospiraceae bacterium]